MARTRLKLCEEPRRHSSRERSKRRSRDLRRFPVGRQRKRRRRRRRIWNDHPLRRARTTRPSFIRINPSNNTDQRRGILHRYGGHLSADSQNIFIRLESYQILKWILYAVLLCRIREKKCFRIESVQCHVQKAKSLLRLVPQVI
ncbi:uncharacterized protein LOC105427779 [Pogonomyrmex barbatus]|uniref:Uncharacterized protein LOC105427779 n=1 Tax=Pogonomyrmex barbatus TaxID=144034 RepID=A0A6I9W895_9HYME|nr:uncharacterized protein LOC105427779 [Pogonomyrmex barbatus]